TLKQISQRKTQPGDDHGPALNTAQTIDTLLQSVGRQQFIQGQTPWASHLTIHPKRPGLRLPVPRMASRIPLLRTELVEIVVLRDITKRREHLIPGISTLPTCLHQLVAQPIWILARRHLAIRRDACATRRSMST